MRRAPTAAALAAALAALAAPVAVAQPVTQPTSPGESVTVTGTGPDGGRVSASGTRRPDGTVELVDRTTPWYDPASGTGAVETYDAGGNGELPGALVTSPTVEIGDSEAIAVHAMHRYVLDHLAQVFGRRSWDGRGASLRGAVRSPVPCNAMFVWAVSMPVYGTCPGHSVVDVDVVAHEVVHGITRSSSRLVYRGQAGALNESFSDYLGNVIGDDYLGRTSTTIGEHGCRDAPGPDLLCRPTPEGALAARSLVNPVTFADYLELLDAPAYASLGLNLHHDFGGVHFNSAIWNRALWTIRDRLAAVDGVEARHSPRAREFDRIVYLALTGYLTPAAGFLDARAALEQAAGARGADAATTDTIREVMDHVAVCAGCVPTADSPGVAVTATAAQEQFPQVAAGRYAWLEYRGGDLTGSVVVRDPDGSLRELATGATALTAVGDRLVTLEPVPGTPGGRVVLYDVGGDQRELARSAQILGPVAGSETLAAWFTDRLHAVDAAGGVTATDPGLSGRVVSLGAGAGTVALGTDEGEVAVWVPARGPEVTVVHRTPGSSVLAVDAHGSRVAATLVEGQPGQWPDGPEVIRNYVGRTLLLDAARPAAEPVTLSQRAYVFGLEVTDRYVVWPEVTGTLAGPVADVIGIPVPALDLYLHSAATGVTYDLVTGSGQEAFPHIVAGRLLWVGAGRAGNEIYTAVVPDGL